MIDKCKGKLNGDNFSHVKQFFMFIPPLTLNYVQSLLVAKEKLVKKNFKGGYISDDGFIIGLTFLVEILQQKDNLRGIHWFSEVKNKVSAEVKLLEEQTLNMAQKDVKIDTRFQDDESIEVGLYLRTRKSFLDEFILLENGYRAAQVLFKDTTVKQTDFFINDENEQ